MGKKVTCIITPTWNKEDFTIRCFDSIRKNTKLPYKIIWIDNGSEEASRQKVADFLKKNNVPHEKILNEENLGFVKATNQGILKALELNAKYFVFQNNDTEVFEGWLEKYIEVAESDPKIGLVGPVTSPSISWQAVDNLREKNEDFADLPEYTGNPEEYAEILKKKFSGQVYDAPLGRFAFFSTLVKNETVRSIGFLSEEYGIGLGDDDDYCIRARMQGWKIVVAKDIFVFHNHRTTFKENFSGKEIQEMSDHNLKLLYRKRMEMISSKASEGFKDEIKLLNEIILQKNRELHEIRSSLKWLVPNYFHKRYKKYIKPYIPRFVFQFLNPIIAKLSPYKIEKKGRESKQAGLQKSEVKAQLPEEIPLISVIIPSRVGEKIETLSFLEEQTYKNLEIIIEYDFKGQGVSATRNRGAEKATGKYLFFCDNDVKLKPDALENLYKTAEETGAKWVFGKFQIDGGEVRNEGKDLRVPSDEKTVAFIEWFRGISTMSLIDASAKPRFDEEFRKYNDWDLWLTLFKKGYKPAFCDRIIFDTESKPNGISSCGPKEASRWQDELYKKHGIIFEKSNSEN